MSSPGSYTLVDRIDDGSLPNRRRESVTRLQVSSNIETNVKSIRCPSPTIHSHAEPKLNLNNENAILRDQLTFVFLDLDSQLNSNPIAPIRAIHHDLQTFLDVELCLKFIRFSNDKIFFITTSVDRQLLEEFHSIKSIEAIFILNSDARLDSRFPKLYGAYAHYEELLKGLKETFDWYEQTQMEIFVCEHDRIFVWLQLWRDEFLKIQKSKSSPSTKEKLIESAENYYHGNIKIQSSIREFDQYYTKTDALQWCFSAPFPSRFLHHTLYSLNTDHLQACQFLLIDLSRVIHSVNKKGSCELYKGMKMTNDYLTKMENYVGKLICPKGFLQCTQSRRQALDQANSPDHRPDLISVLIKITYDASVPLATLPSKHHSSLMIFDVYTVFRIKYVKRGQLTTIKIEPADDDGKRLAREYRIEHEPDTVQHLLDQLLVPLKHPARLPPLVPRLQRSLSILSDLSQNEVTLSVIPEGDDDENKAHELIQSGQIDQAIAVYQGIKPESARILNIIGSLFHDKKADYGSAITYFKKALKIQERNGEDVINTLSRLGNAHQSRQEFDLALACYTRALNKAKKDSKTDPSIVASTLIGVANAHWGQHNYTEALTHAQQALTLNESIERGNDTNISANLAILANIYHTSGDTHRALDMATRGLGILERCLPEDSPVLATMLNNIATMQVALGLLSDARKSFERALGICKKTLPEGHPKQIAMENNLRRVINMQQQNGESMNL